MLQNAYFLAKIGADTAENERYFAEILPIGRRVADRCPGAPLRCDGIQDTAGCVRNDSEGILAKCRFPRKATNQGHRRMRRDTAGYARITLGASGCVRISKEVENEVL